MLPLLYSITQAVLLTRNARPTGQPGVGLPCIPLHEVRMLAPGCTRTMHLYDSSCVAAFKAAMAGDGSFALVALDTMATASRSFSLRSVACGVQILDVRTGEKESKFGDASLSYYVDIIGTRRIDTKGVKLVQFEPYVALENAPPTFDAAPTDHDVEAAAARCAELADLVEPVAELQLELSPAGGQDAPTASDELSTVDACVAKVLEVTDADDAEPARRLLLEVLASTRYLPPSARWELLQERQLLPLAENVVAALGEELKRLRAMQSLKSL